MKNVNLLLISLIVLIFGCKNDTKETKTNEPKQQIKILKDTNPDTQKGGAKADVLKDTTKVNTVNKHKVTVKKDPRLKVVINGKTYYKKNVNDHRADSRYGFEYLYYDIKKKREYYIDNGKYNYGPPISETGVHGKDNDPAYNQNQK